VLCGGLVFEEAMDLSSGRLRDNNDDDDDDDFLDSCWESPRLRSGGYWEFLVEKKGPGREAGHSVVIYRQTLKNGAASPLNHTSSWGGAEVYMNSFNKEGDDCLWQRLPKS
jgi:hypothetical protein